VGNSEGSLRGECIFFKATALSDRPALPYGEVGVVVGRGPQVMKRYYKFPEAMTKAIGEYGWFDTGDFSTFSPLLNTMVSLARPALIRTPVTGQ
jgi:long-subunit acyl-CoA synthetase (AMP-forming)